MLMCEWDTRLTLKNTLDNLLIDYLVLTICDRDKDSQVSENLENYVGGAIDRVPITKVYSRSSQLILNKMYRLLVAVTNGNEQDVYCVMSYFESKCKNPSRYSLHCYTYYPRPRVTVTSNKLTISCPTLYISTYSHLSHKLSLETHVFFLYVRVHVLYSVQYSIHSHCMQRIQMDT
jgi:hypothetical protein